MNKPWQTPPLLLVIAVTALLCGCAVPGGGATDSAARGRVLRVAESPPSLGCKRLQQHSRACPALKEFLHARGLPDFIIEDTGFTSRKIVVFYVRPDQAYLISIKSGLAGQKFEVSGPEPIGKQTKALFTALDRLEQAEASLAATSVPLKKAMH